KTISLSLSVITTPKGFRPVNGFQAWCFISSTIKPIIGGKCQLCSPRQGWILGRLICWFRFPKSLRHDPSLQFCSLPCGTSVPRRTPIRTTCACVCSSGQHHHPHLQP